MIVPVILIANTFAITLGLRMNMLIDNKLLLMGNERLRESNIKPNQTTFLL